MEGYGNENPGAFQSTRPLRGATLWCRRCKASNIVFQPTRPLRGATGTSPASASGATVISTHAPLAGRDVYMRVKAITAHISTHAPLAGRDQVSMAAWIYRRHFNPRAPCGARHSTPGTDSAASIFQPTRPLRGATKLSMPLSCSSIFQPTRPLRGATFRARMVRPGSPFQPTRPLRGATVGVVGVHRSVSISTHAPLAGRDE